MSISRWKRFRKDEDGSVLVESILWLPFFLILTVAVLDICMIYLNLAFAQRVMQDGNRLLVTGKYKSCTETIDFIHARVQPGIPSANASCVIDGTVVRMRMTMKTGDMDITGATGLFGNYEIGTSTVYVAEYVPGF